MSRRRDALFFTVTTVASASGCLSTFQYNSKTADSLDPGEKMQATGEPVAETKSTFDENYEYVSENNTIRYPTKRSGPEVVEYGYRKFDDWARARAERVAEIVGGRTYEPTLWDRPNLRIYLKREDGPERVEVIYIQRVNDEGEVVNEPDVDLQELVHTIPEHIDVRITFSGRSATYRIPYYVSKHRMRKQAPTNVA